MQVVSHDCRFYRQKAVVPEFETVVYRIAEVNILARPRQAPNGQVPSLASHALNDG
jgi:hypothetical protein